MYSLGGGGDGGGKGGGGPASAYLELSWLAMKMQNSIVIPGVVNIDVRGRRVRI